VATRCLVGGLGVSGHALYSFDVFADRIEARSITPMSVVTGQRSVLRGAGAGSTPAHALLGAHAGSFLALQREHFGVTGIRVAPPQVVVQLCG